MKKLFISMVLISFVTMNYAQKVDIRAYGGFGMSEFSNKNTNLLNNLVNHTESISGMPGAQAGFKLGYGHRVYIEPGIEWSQVVLKVINKSTVNDSTYEDNAKLNMISIPLHVGVKLFDTEKQKLFNVRLIGGVTGSSVLSVNHSKRSTLNNDFEKEDFKKMIFSADAGLGIDIWIFYVELQYKFGFTPVFSGNGNNSTYTNLHLNAGLKFTL
jgi:hypothetical protein